MLSGKLNGPAGRGGCRLIRQGKGAEMKYFCFRDKGLAYFLRREAGIRSGFPGKAEVPVSGSIQGYESKRRKDGGIGDDPGCINTCAVQCFYQQLPPFFREPRA